MKKNISIAFVIFMFCLFLQLNSEGESGGSLDDICDLDGYTMISCTNVDGEFEGDSGDIVKLWDGMKFELEDSHYNYAYSPDVGVFAKKIDFQGKSFISYKLLVEDEIYDASRIK